jgi:hypothetical protein
MSALPLSALMIVALANPSGEPPKVDSKPVPTTNANALEMNQRFEVDVGAPVLTGLLPSAVSGARVIDKVSGEVRSLPEIFEAAGRTDLVKEFYTRVGARWLFIGAGAVAGAAGLAAVGLFAASSTLGVPAGLPYGAAGVAGIAAATAISGIGTGVVLAVLGFAIKPLPVAATEIEKMTAQLNRTSGE